MLFVWHCLWHCISVCVQWRCSQCPRAARWSPSCYRMELWPRFVLAAQNQRSSITLSSALHQEKGQWTLTPKCVDFSWCVTVSLTARVSVLQWRVQSGGGAPTGDGRSAHRLPGARKEQPDWLLGLSLVSSPQVPPVTPRSISLSLQKLLYITVKSTWRRWLKEQETLQSWCSSQPVVLMLMMLLLWRFISDTVRTVTCWWR